MQAVNDVKNLDLDSIPNEPFWNTGNERESRMHRIHSYPAKFPAFITTKALEFAKKDQISISWIADIFCGCGTVAFEAKRNGINFWGCDVNPVATMIARTKSRNYNTDKIQNYYDSILKEYRKLHTKNFAYNKANERIKYWYEKKQFVNLSRLKESILRAVPAKSSYHLFFLCAFSSILKPTSRWLTKSIKPQIDPVKVPADVLQSFSEQCSFMIQANNENDANTQTHTKIVNANFLDESIEHPIVDMIITSPPYVTSYEYADLHQLSSLWLSYTEDYRELRNGSIGSHYHDYNFEKELKRLNKTGTNIVFRLLNQDKAKARSVAKYFLDMQQVAKVCVNMLSDKGLALFVVGNTEYKGVRIDNARHLTESLLENGFAEVFVTKRKITGKTLTPYRDEKGKFTTDKNSREVYGEEFILIGRK